MWRFLERLSLLYRTTNRGSPAVDCSLFKRFYANTRRIERVRSFSIGRVRFQDEFARRVQQVRTQFARPETITTRNRTRVFRVAIADCGGPCANNMDRRDENAQEGKKPSVMGRRNNKYRAKLFLTRPRARRSFGLFVLPSVGAHHVVVLVAGTLVLAGPAKQRQFYSLSLQSIGSCEMQTRVRIVQIFWPFWTVILAKKKKLLK